MSCTRDDLIKALAMNCAAECVYQGMNSDGSLSTDDNGVPFIAKDARPTVMDCEALEDTLEGTVYKEDRVLFRDTFKEAVNTLLKVIPRRES